MKKNYPYIYKDLLQMLKFAVYKYIEKISLFSECLFGGISDEPKP